MTRDIRATFGKKVRTLRLAKDLTQAELAEAAGIDYKYLQRIESQYSPNLTLDTIQKLAKALKTTPAELLK